LKEILSVIAASFGLSICLPIYASFFEMQDVLNYVDKHEWAAIPLAMLLWAVFELFKSLALRWLTRT